jgi:hypothetical protein
MRAPKLGQGLGWLAAVVALSMGATLGIHLSPVSTDSDEPGILATDLDESGGSPDDFTWG